MVEEDLENAAVIDAGDGVGAIPMKVDLESRRRDRYVHNLNVYTLVSESKPHICDDGHRFVAAE